MIDSDADFVRVNLASLHCTHLHPIQRQLLKEATDVNYQTPEDRRISIYMPHEFYMARERIVLSKAFTRAEAVQALKGQECIKQCAVKSHEDDPFLVITRKTLDRVLLQEVTDECRKKMKGSK